MKKVITFENGNKIYYDPELLKPPSSKGAKNKIKKAAFGHRKNKIVYKIK